MSEVAFSDGCSMEATHCVQVQDDASRKWLSTIAFFFRKAVVSLRVPSAFILAGATLFFFESAEANSEIAYLYYVSVFYVIKFYVLTDKPKITMYVA